MALDLSGLTMLEAAVQAAAPWGVHVAVTDPGQGASEGEVFYSEAVAMARAVPKRRNEFFAGRLAAHRAMERCNMPASPVPMGKDRAPEWPTGLVGSISHCDRACVAMVADKTRYQSVAVDIEPDEALPDEVMSMVCLPSERSWLDARPVDERGRLARVIFSIKECAYKLQYPVTKKMLDFSDVNVVLDLDTERFELRVARGCNPFGDHVKMGGRFGVEGGVTYSVMFALQDIGKTR